jgi:hypothetical protein
MPHYVQRTKSSVPPSRARLGPITDFKSAPSACVHELWQLPSRPRDAFEIAAAVFPDTEAARQAVDRLRFSWGYVAPPLLGAGEVIGDRCDSSKRPEVIFSVGTVTVYVSGDASPDSAERTLSLARAIEARLRKAPVQGGGCGPRQ